LHVTGHVGGHDRVAGVGLQLAVHDLVGVGRVRHAHVAERAQGELTAEHALVELQGLAGSAVEIEIRIESRCHRNSPLQRRKVSTCGRRYQPGVTKPDDRGRAAGVTCCAMNDEDGYFGEDVAATYDDGFEGQFDPSVIEVTAG